MPLKTAAIGRAGLEYQDLVGIGRLIDFYRNQRKYRWIELESEDAQMGFLDDIVIALSDGTFDLIQVKYTVDPTRYFLDWDWLLTKEGKGTSLLEKWAGTIHGFADPINIACLETNRIPDGDFGASLDDTGRVNFNGLDAVRRAQLESEIGGTYLARKFFERFQFFHSKQMLDDFEADLQSSIVPTDTDIVGWMTLRAQAKRWAMHKNAPEPDGRITHKHLTQIITKKAPRPIPQDFAIPSGYAVPSQAFHERFLKLVKEGSSITVLWGTPGRGKSTYLSFVSNELREAQFPLIRHHYFLSLDDPTTDRFSFNQIAESLMHQMASLYPEALKDSGVERQPDQLSKWIAACGEFFQKSGKVFLVVIDGLDHVWRERRNLDQLNHLFEHLIPIATNVGLIVGTQKIPDEKLPARLLRKLKKKDWWEIPPMDELSVQSWVKQQHVAKRLRLPKHQASDESIAQKLGSIGRAFFDISGGHPLHLIYSFEALVRTGNYVDDKAIRLLPSCPDGDINNYYGALWRKLSKSAREIVHLIAGSDFHWPLDGIVRYFGQIDEVDFLLEHRRVGLVPFHGSILAFVREKADHRSVLRSLLPRVVRWLKKDAPPYWKWGWLWLTQSKMNEHAPLLRGAARAWAIESIKDGWPVEQVTTVLKAAEQITFESGDYAKTIELRALKHRVLAAPEHQIGDYKRLTECAMLASSNVQMVDVLADTLPALDDDTVVMLCRVGRHLKPEVCEEAKRELANRVNLWIRLRHRSGDQFVKLSKCFLEACALCEEVEVKRLITFIDKFTDAQGIFDFFLDALVSERKFEALTNLYSAIRGKNNDWRVAVLDAMIRVATMLPIDATSIIGNLAIKELSPFAACWMHYQKVSVAASFEAPPRPAELDDRDRDKQRTSAEEYLYQRFFFELHGGLTNSNVVPIADLRGRNFIDHAISLITTTARNIATGRSQLSFSTPYYAASQISPVADKNYSDPSHNQYMGFRRALRRIAIDLHILKQPSGTFRSVSDDELRTARGSTHWTEQPWTEEQVAQRLQILSTNQAAASLADEVRHLRESVTQFDERGDKWLLLSRFAALYQLPNVSELVRRAVDCALGYGWRKDLWMIDVLKSVADVHKSGAAQGLPMLRELAPIVDKVTEFTDGDETDYIRSKFIDVVSEVSPQRLPNLYAHHLEADEFRYAEEALERHLNVANPESDVTLSLARTFVEHNDISVLSKLADRSPKMRQALGEQMSFLGGMPPKRMEYPESNSDFGRRGNPPDVAKFGPDDFRKLVAHIDKTLGYEKHGEVLLNWLLHWEKTGKARQALRGIKTFYEEEDRTSTADRVLDDAFLVSKRVEGKKAAYYWLVQAHIYRNGWRSYWASESEVVSRLANAAKFFRSDWKKFIHDTSVPEKYWLRRGYGFVIGTNSLVRFLLMVGQEKKALDFTRACIKVVRAEVSDQPLPATPWFD